MVWQGTGIGKAIASELLGLGCSVLIASRSEETLQAAMPDLEAVAKKSGEPSVQYVAGSIKNENDAKRIVSTAIQTFGRLDFLVNNGGGQFEQAAADMKLKGWTAVIETNLTGPWLMSTLAYNMWMRDHGGAIVVITAAPHDRQGDPGMSHTAAARAGADNLCKTLSVEWAASQVRVNAVAPGSIYSETAEANYTDREDFADASPTGPKAGWMNIPAKRAGTVEEVSSAVTWLLSPGARYVSGSTLTVDAALSNVKASVSGMLKLSCVHRCHHGCVISSSLLAAVTFCLTILLQCWLLLALRCRYDDPWPVYGAREVPRPSKQVLLSGEEAVVQGRVLPTDRLSFPNRILDRVATNRIGSKL